MLQINRIELRLRIPGGCGKDWHSPKTLVGVGNKKGVGNLPLSKGMAQPTASVPTGKSGGYL